jgi:hypothetical protein
MKQTISLATVLVLAAAGSASAGGTADSVGVGAEFGLNGEAGGVSMNYDAGKFHVGGFLGVFDGGGDDDTDFTIGGRFFYHVASTAMSDFGIGGGLSFRSIDDRGMPGGRDTHMYLEPSFQIRVFLASNVALSFTAGIVIGLVDAQDDYGISLGPPSVGGLNTGLGFVTATGGVHYYF